jgi:hypothetical protein
MDSFHPQNILMTAATILSLLCYRTIAIDLLLHELTDKTPPVLLTITTAVSDVTLLLEPKGELQGVH